MNEATRLYHRIRAMVLRDINAALAGRNTAGGATATVVEGHSHDDRYPLESELDAHIAATGVSVHGLGSISTQSAAGVNITGGSITGITDLAVADGGTGASTASGARTNLGLVIGTDVQAYDAELAAIAALAVTDSNIIVGNGTTWVAESGATARTSLGLGTGDSPQFTALNIGHASDTTIARVSAGLISVEGDTVTLNTATQTLTNKTLTAPVIATIVNTGTLTLPTSTDTLVGRATTDTLTNKTYSGGTNSGTFAGDHTLSGAVTFSNATSPIIAAKLGPASGQQHTLPAVTSDTVALLAATQTLTNKTLTTPTIASFVNATHTHQNAAGGGTLDHGAALTGLGDDDHTQYLLATGTRAGATSQAQTFTSGVIDSSLTASRLLASNGGKQLASVADLTSWIAGTSNRVTVTSDGDGSVTLSGPQDIHTAATPTFSRLTLSQTTGTAPLTVSSTTKVANLNADLLDDLNTSSNPGAAAAVLVSDASGFLTLVKLNTDTLADKSGGNLSIAPAGDVVFDPTGNDLLPASNYDLNIGSLSKKYLTLHAAELWVETLVAQDTIATIGGRILVGPTSYLTRDLASGGTTFYVKHNEMASGDRAYMEANGKVEFFAITSSATEITPNVEYSYTVTRNLDGTGANEWYAGDAIFNTGTTGDGFIDLYSLRSVKSATQYGPAIVGNVRNSSTYNDWTEHWAIGNLNGVYGYGATTYGFAAGKYASGQPWVAVDATNGFRVMRHTTQMAQWDTSGNITVGQVASGQSNVYISSGAVKLRNNTTDVITLLATANANGQIATFDGAIGISTSGGIYQGTGTFASPTTGLKIWNNSGAAKIAAYDSGTEQWAADANGISLLHGSASGYYGQRSISWKTGATVKAYALSFDESSITNFQLINQSSTTSTAMLIKSAAPSGGGYNAVLDIQATAAATGGSLNLQYDNSSGAIATLATPTGSIGLVGSTGTFTGTFTANAFANTGLHLLDTDASHDLIIAPGSNLTADRTLTVTTGDANRTLTLTGNATLDQDVSTAGSPAFAEITAPIVYGTRTVIWTATSSTSGSITDGVLYVNIGDISYTGQITIEVGGGWNIGQATGRIVRSFSFHRSAGATSFSNLSAATLEASGQAGTRLAVGNIELDETVMRIPIYKLIDSNSIDVWVRISAQSVNQTHITNLVAGLALSPWITVTNSVARQYPFTDERFGVKQPDPAYDLDVSGTLRATGAAYLNDIRPVSDSTTALQWKRSGGTAVVTVDTTNSRMGINKTPGSYDLDVNGGMYVGGGTRLNGNVGIADNPGSWALKVNGDASAVRIGLGTDPNPSYRIDAAGNIKIGGDIWATGNLDVDGEIVVDGYVGKGRTFNQSVAASGTWNTGITISDPSQWLVNVMVSTASGSGLVESATWLVTRMGSTKWAQLTGGLEAHHTVVVDAGYEIDIQNDTAGTRYISAAFLRIL